MKRLWLSLVALALVLPVSYLDTLSAQQEEPPEADCTTWTCLKIMFDDQLESQEMTVWIHSDSLVAYTQRLASDPDVEVTHGVHGDGRGVPVWKWTCFRVGDMSFCFQIEQEVPVQVPEDSDVWWDDLPDYDGVGIGPPPS